MAVADKPGDIPFMEDIETLYEIARGRFESDPGVSIHDVAQALRIVALEMDDPVYLLSLAVAEGALGQHEGDWA